jgi:hypothetical protein
VAKNSIVARLYIVVAVVSFVFLAACGGHGNPTGPTGSNNGSGGDGGGNGGGVKSTAISLDSIYTEEDGVVTSGGNVQYVSKLHIRVKASATNISDENLLVSADVETAGGTGTQVSGYVKQQLIGPGLFEILYVVEAPPLGLPAGTKTTVLNLYLCDNTVKGGTLPLLMRTRVSYDITWIKRPDEV